MLFTPFISLDENLTRSDPGGHSGPLTGAHERAHPNQLKADDAISLFVYLRKISFSVMLSVYIFLYFLYFGHRGYFLWPV